MKSIFTVSAAIVVAAAVSGVSPAQAQRAPTFTSAYNWTGFYAGVNAGIGVGQDYFRHTFPTTPSFNEAAHLAPIGAIAGVQAGYNRQYGNWVFGIETDLQLGTQKDDHTCMMLCTDFFFGGPTSMTVDRSLDWIGTTRGRIGYASGPVMSYVTGGLAYGRVSTTVNLVGGLTPTAPFKFSDTATGYAIGSGVEAALGGNWTAKLEYLYVDLGNHNLVLATCPCGSEMLETEVRQHLVRGGLNYQIGGSNALYSAEPAMRWTGFYVGGNFGSAIGRNESTYAVNEPTFPLSFNDEKFNFSPTGYVGGVQAGFNFNLTPRVVVGVEADIQGSTQKDDKACLAFCDLGFPLGMGTRAEQSMPWFGTVRGRIGYVAGPALIYATAGLAYGNLRTRITDDYGFGEVFAHEFKTRRTGWVAGAGIERPFDLFGLLPGTGWTAKAEYLYVDLGDTRSAYTTNPSIFDPLVLSHALTTQATSHIFRTGLNYQFTPGGTIR